MLIQTADEDMPELKDPHVYIHLVSGRIIELQDVSINAIAEAVMRRGYVYLGDGTGKYLYLFRQGIAAITASND